MKLPRVALIHDWLVTWQAGSERVLAHMLAEFPGADVYAILDKLPPYDRGPLEDRRVHTSFLQKIPGAARFYRSMLPLMPLAVESLDLSGYDLILSSSHAVAKGVITAPRQLHVCYCHTPIRYAWDLQHQYLKESHLDRGIRKLLALSLLHYIRLWDLRTVPAVDHFIANSEFVARRIEKFYRREATVIYPPVDVDGFAAGGRREDFYLVVARLVPYKRIDILLKAFERMPNRRLVVIGDGPLKKSLRAGSPPNVQFLGRQSQESMRAHLQRARAFLYAAEEDFGISIVEAQACGTPVIAYAAGGALETVIHERTGFLFEEQSPESVVTAIRRFESSDQNFSPEMIRRHSQRFSDERFRRQYRSFVLQCCSEQNFNPCLREWAEAQSRPAAAYATGR